MLHFKARRKEINDNRAMKQSSAPSQLLAREDTLNILDLMIIKRAISNILKYPTQARLFGAITMTKDLEKIGSRLDYKHGIQRGCIWQHAAVASCHLPLSYAKSFCVGIKNSPSAIAEPKKQDNAP